MVVCICVCVCKLYCVLTIILNKFIMEPTCPLAHLHAIIILIALTQYFGISVSFCLSLPHRLVV